MRQEIKTMYNRQLLVLGILALLVAPIVWFVTCVVYGLPFPESISETATIANRTAMVLPTILGALGIFGLTYKSRHNSKGDTWCGRIMGIGFILVALQQCFSETYIEYARIGAFGLAPEVSNIVHSVGALLGFGTLLVWQFVFFTKTDPRVPMTEEKRKRNTLYRVCSAFTLIGITIFGMGALGLVHETFAFVFWAEAAILTFAGISCIVKSEMFNIIKDK